MKEIILVGKFDGSALLQYVTHSSKYKVRTATDVQDMEKLLKQCDPDFVLCTGRIKQNPDGQYFLEL